LYLRRIKELLLIFMDVSTQKKLTEESL